MRARNIKPGLFLNEFLGVEDPIITLLFVGLWCIADRDGRLEDRPARIKAELFPYRDLPVVNGECQEVNRGLTVLERLGFIVRYEIAGCRYIQIHNFRKHQNPHHTEKKGDIPAPPQVVGTKEVNFVTVSSRLDNGEYLADSLIPDSLIQDKDKPPISPPRGTEIENDKAEDKPKRTRKPRSVIPYPPEFEDWWLQYPKHRREGKDKAVEAYPRAVERIVANRHLDYEQARGFLRQRTIEYAVSPHGNNGVFTPLPVSWLNAGHFEDEPESWNAKQLQQKTLPVGNGQVHPLETNEF